MAQDKNQELLMREHDLIVSKTDPKGKITYGNQIFIRFSGYDEKNLLGQPHNMIRHPDMPRTVFRLLWETLQKGEEFFGFIKNECNNGQFYWTFAHVTPSYDENSRLLGYYSVRRCPKRSSIETMEPLYQKMLQQEVRHSSSKEAMDAAEIILNQHIQSSGKSYNEFILTLEK